MKNNYKYFTIICLLYLVQTFLINFFLDIYNLYYSYYSDQFSQEHVNQLLENKEEWSWVGYIILPLLIFFRTSLVSLCLSIGMFFYDTENKIKFKNLYRISLLGEFVLLLVGFSKLFFFYFIKTNFTLQDLQQFYPLSYANFLDFTKIEPWLIHPLQTINLFEIGYFFVLVYGLHKLLKNKYAKSFEIVAASYGTGLFIWLGLVMFLTLNIS
jgi:hypothetical protein